MQGLKEMLLQEQQRLRGIIERAEKELSMAPDGWLRVSRDVNKIRYYHCTDDKNGVYIHKVNTELPKQLAQKKYNMTVMKKAQKREKDIKKLLRDYSDDEIEEIYKSLHKERQALVMPVEPTWEQLVEQWYSVEYQGKEFREGAAIILTEKGERVRSKSEKILADYFYRNNILYQYEKPLKLKGYGIVYPDFTLLSRKTRKEMYWEHEGMMDQPEYARAAVAKIDSYQKNGIYIGENLIVTFETEKNVLSTKTIEELVEKYL